MFFSSKVLVTQLFNALPGWKRKRCPKKWVDKFLIRECEGNGPLSPQCVGGDSSPNKSLTSEPFHKIQIWGIGPLPPLPRMLSIMAQLSCLVSEGEPWKTVNLSILGVEGAHLSCKLKPLNLLKKGLRPFFKRFVIDWVRGSRPKKLKICIFLLLFVLSLKLPFLGYFPLRLNLAV